MARTKLIIKNKVFLNHGIFMGLIDDFINDSYSGRRLRSDGQKITFATVQNYEILKKTLDRFCEKYGFQLRIYIYNNLTPSQRDNATKWYMKFYQKFTKYLYDDQFYFDNYVGLIIKMLKSFFKYVEIERDVSFGNYTRYFHVPQEEIPIIALQPGQLRYIIHSNDLAAKLDEKMTEVKDFFIFGCTVALRISDLTSLTRKNLIIRNGEYYLNVKAEKTNFRTSLKLPPYAEEIIVKYDKKYPTLLPPVSMAWMNVLLKRFAGYLPDDFEIPKIRERRGKPVVIYKNNDTKEHYHLSDHICTHTMRRTAITTMLTLGLPEQMVRQISGHKANSKEFYRYVQLSQNFMDQETDKVFNKLCTWNPYDQKSIL